MTHRTNKSSAEAQMIRCCDCDEVMYGIFSRKARNTCAPCGGQALNAINPRYPQPLKVKERKHA